MFANALANVSQNPRNVSHVSHVSHFGRPGPAQSYRLRLSLSLSLSLCLSLSLSLSLLTSYLPTFLPFKLSTYNPTTLQRFNLHMRFLLLRLPVDTQQIPQRRAGSANRFGAAKKTTRPITGQALGAPSVLLVVRAAGALAPGRASCSPPTCWPG